MEHKFALAALREDNYASWSNMMRLYLKSLNCWQFIEGKVAKPKESDVALFYRASAVISSSVSQELSYLVLTNEEIPESSSPFQLWSSIERHFCPHSKKNLAKLKCQFFSAKIDPQEDVGKFISRINALACQLNSIIGKANPDGISNISEGDRLAVLTEGIEQEFPEAYNALSLSPGLSFEQTASFMVSHCTRSKGEVPPGNASVNMSRSRSKAPKKCTHCGRVGHTVEYCYDLHPEKRKASAAGEITIL
jgi:hypothetical protein